MEQIKKRRFWINKISNLWKKTSVIWLHGVRRVGKTCLCLNISDAEYFDCELPRTRRLFEDAEEFLKVRRNKKIATKSSEYEFQEWLDAFWSKDIQELFRLERRYSFQKFIELLFIQSGGIFEASQFARPTEVSRTTISNYLKVLEATSVIYILKPFSSYSASEDYISTKGLRF